MSDDTTAVNPRYRRYIRRLEQLIDRGNELSDERKFVPTPGLTKKYHDDADDQQYRAWLVNCEALLEQVFGKDSPYIREFQKITANSALFPSYPRRMTGVLWGALDDLRGGFLLGQQFIVAGVVFDDVLQEAKHLQSVGHKDAAAVLGRTVLEDALRRLARRAELDDTGKISGVNDRLREEGLLTQPRWRGVRTMLDVGNAAAHGEFDQYDHGDVAKMLDDIEGFLATEFHA